VSFLKQHAGSHCSTFTNESAPVTADSVGLDWHVDAATDKLPVEQSEAGLGGWAGGYWWSWPLPWEDRDIPIVI
jgi:hypothetical protein